MGVIDVRISLIGGELKPSVDPVILSKGNGETIKWHNDTAQDVTVKFSFGTPFPPGRDPYTIRAGKSTDSGSIQVDADTQWQYDLVTSTGQVADPQVIIHR